MRRVTSSSSLKTRLAKIEARIEARRPVPPTESSLISTERGYLRALAKAWGDPGDVEEVEGMSDSEVLESARTSPARRRALLEEIYASADLDEVPAPALPALRGSKLG